MRVAVSDLYSRCGEYGLTYLGPDSGRDLGWWVVDGAGRPMFVLRGGYKRPWGAFCDVIRGGGSERAARRAAERAA